MRFLSVDYNFKSINLAISDETGTIAMDLPPVDNQSWLAATSAIKKICEESGVTDIVVGVTLRNKGVVGTKGAVGLEFYEFLKENIDLTVETWEERLPSKFIQRAVNKTVKKSKRKKEQRDENVKARWILQGYIDRRLMEKEDEEL